MLRVLTIAFSLTFSPLALAQRPFPSMITAICAGSRVGSSPSGNGARRCESVLVAGERLKTATQRDYLNYAALGAWPRLH